MKLSVEGLAEIVGEAETIKVTGTTCEVAPGAAIVMVPVKVPALVRPDVFMETLALPGIVPPALVTSHPAGPEVMAAVAVNVKPEVPVMFRGCADGAEVPI